MTINFERAVVTGGAGFIGSHLVDRLLKEKCHVTVIDDLSSGKGENLAQHSGNKHLRFQQASILEPDKLMQEVKDSERIFHEAAVVSPEYATLHPAETSQVNVQGTLNLLEAARRADIGHFIYASSAAVYGEVDKLPINEDAHTEPISPYGASKLAGEVFTRAYHKTYGLKTTSLRYFNVYGPRQVQNPYSGVITIFLQRLQVGKTLEIQGDGNQTRDFIYISDVADANIKAASTAASAGEVFNIATGRPTSINQLAEIMGSVLKVHFTSRKIAPRRGDISNSIADVRRAREVLGFEARVGLREGLEEYVK